MRQAQRASEIRSLRPVQASSPPALVHGKPAEIPSRSLRSAGVWTRVRRFHVSPFHLWQLPVGAFYVAAIALAGVASWERWHSGYPTVIAALTASACTLTLEIGLRIASPRAARSLYGVGGAGWMFYALTVGACVSAAFLIVSLGL